MQGVALLGRPKFLVGVWDDENGTLYRGHWWGWSCSFFGRLLTLIRTPFWNGLAIHCHHVLMGPVDKK